MWLYETPRTRSSRCRWVLQELGIPFEAVQVNLSEGEHYRQEFLKLNPYGRVPVLVDGELVMSESIAICLYLADKYADRHLIPKPGTPQRAVHDQWLLFCANELDQPLWQIRRHTSLYPLEQRLPAEVNIARGNFLAALKIVDHALGDHHYLATSEFSVVDIVLTQTLIWAAGYALLDEFPNLIAYLNRHKARKSCPEELG
jgi:glutathione S-transferase